MPAKTTNSFADWDVTKIWADMKLPSVDAEAFMAAQQRNIAALSEANKLAVDGAQAIARRQAEIARDVFEQSAEAVKEMAAITSPQERMVRQAELTREAFEMGLETVREFSDMFAQTADKTADLMKSRYAESIDELKTMVANGPVAAAGKAAPATTEPAKK